MAGVTVEHLTQALSKYLPERTAHPLAQIIVDYQISLKITRSRSTKFGDYRSPHQGKGHQISINGDLNEFHFLITLLHEIAHCFTFIRHQRQVAPHGKEWKMQFKTLLEPFIKHKIFPEDIQTALIKHIEKIKASSCTDRNLLFVLKSYDPIPEGSEQVILEALAEGSFFIFREKQFQKGILRRTRIMCQELDSKKWYLFHPLAEVVPIFAP